MRALAGLLVAVVAVQAAPAVRTIDRQAPCRAGQVVRVAHRYGSIIARRGTADTLVVTATARVDGRDRRQVAGFLADIDLSLAAWADTVFVAILYPELVEPSDEFSYEVDLLLGLPAGVRFEATNAFGDVEVRDASGGSSVANRYGDAHFVRCRDVDVKVTHGDVRVAENAGGLGISCTYGNVYLDEVTDRVDVESRYGDVSGQALDGDVTINNVLGCIETGGGRGHLRLVSRCGQVDARVDDSTLTKLDIVAELARVRLLMPHVLPFRIEGWTNEGSIGTPLPLATRSQAGQRWVSGTSGRGGPRIVFTGAWADFYIGPDTAGGEAKTEGR